MNTFNGQPKLAKTSFALLFILIFSLRSFNSLAQVGYNGQLRMTQHEIISAKGTGHDAPGSSNYSAMVHPE
jgi:hypothetical protein